MTAKHRRTDYLSVFLMVLASFLVVAIMAGTIWAFASGRASLAGDGRKSDQKALLEAAKNDETAIFEDIGLLRAITADVEPATIIVSPFFPYPAGDSAFREELVQKNRTIRTSIIAWFRNRTLAEISGLGEPAVKAALIDVINSHLILGKINALYFESYTVL